MDDPIDSQSESTELHKSYRPREHAAAAKTSRGSSSATEAAISSSGKLSMVHMHEFA